MEAGRKSGQGRGSGGDRRVALAVRRLSRLLARAGRGPGRAPAVAGRPSVHQCCSAPAAGPHRASPGWRRTDEGPAGQSAGGVGGGEDLHPAARVVLPGVQPEGRGP
ncbi:MAG: hypothetical protein MZV64_34585 [Ignavibacteriales bacterium]|nr:hypothetical protein [Ignavibacteriales bacterium]